MERRNRRDARRAQEAPYWNGRFLRLVGRNIQIVAGVPRQMEQPPQPGPVQQPAPVQQPGPVQVNRISSPSNPEDGEFDLEEFEAETVDGDNPPPVMDEEVTTTAPDL